MSGIYYLGLKRKTIRYNNYFKGAVVLSGEIKKEDISFDSLYGKKINYNKISNFAKISKFYDSKIEEIKARDKKAKFMLYNQAAIEYMTNIDSVVCRNNIELIKTLNNKPLIRGLLRDEINLLEYKSLTSDQISFKKINCLFKNKFKRYVVQQPVGFAGVGTFLLDGNSNLENKLNKKITYSVSGYVENSKSLNNTFMISNNHIHIFPGSFQLIAANKELEYDGWDFDSYEKLKTNLKKKIYNQTLKIAKRLQIMGYRGIGGVDYLLKDNHVYFMEINPRFQASSEELDRMLVLKGFPSIFELNYLSFYDEEQFINVCKRLGNNG